MEDDIRKKMPENDAEFTIYLKTALGVLAEDDSEDGSFELLPGVDYEDGATEFRVNWNGHLFDVTVKEV